ncbi:MAG: coproporphyrinogen dehydrogenase HemZ [Clostridia bacterium]|nr:coproporphyrinogen dehydrogenase HemZ [Clostridia bacterium]
MKINDNGKIRVNRYYVQSLCMLFFPGEKFSVKEEEIREGEPTLDYSVTREDDIVSVKVTLSLAGKSETHIAELEVKNGVGEEKTAKLALGTAMYYAGEKLVGMAPAWGMLVGIRPAKLALEMLAEGRTALSVRRQLRRDYLVNPKKATLCIDVAQNERAILEGIREDTCSLYISIPFCPSRCAYCSFVSYSTNRLLSMIPEYIDRLCRDIERAALQMKRAKKKLLTIYIGGGTPTVLTAAELEKLLSCISRNFNTKRLAEFTLEAGRPDTVDEEKLRIAKAYGVTRISINPQTLNNNILESIGRRHTAEDFYNAFDIARNVGIKTINCDLIAGLPGESYPSFAKSVDAVIACAPENITVHTFCVKKSAQIKLDDPGIFKRGVNDTVKSVDYSQLKMKNSGYKPYYMYRQKNAVGNLENVSFTIDGHAGIYNVLIMEENHTIFAVGAGAVAKLVRFDENGEKKLERIFEPKYPYEYMREDEAENEARYNEAIDRFFFGK